MDDDHRFITSGFPMMEFGENFRREHKKLTHHINSTFMTDRR